MRLSGVICAAFVCLCAGLAQAEDPFAGEWHLDATGYVWATSFNGDITIRGREVPANAGFIDILQDADSLVALEGRLGVSKGRVGIYVDGLYNKVGLDSISGPFGNAKIDPTATLVYIESAVFYRAIDLPRQPSPDGQDTWSWGIKADAYAGMRYTNIGLKLDFQNINQSKSKNFDWVDPLVGGRVQLDLSDKWELYLDNNIGGFGAGSHLAYSAIGLVGYNYSLFGLNSTLWAGYKALYQDYSNGSGKDEFRWNMWVHGPIVGTTVRIF